MDLRSRKQEEVPYVYEEEVEGSLENGKDGSKIRLRVSGSKILTWIHRLVTVAVISYLAGLKEWL